jgi:hypothetical protein
VYQKQGYDLFLPNPCQLIIPDHFTSSSKQCVISVMDIGLLNYLRKHVTCIMYNNKNIDFMA